MRNEVYLIDNMDYMLDLQDNAFDLAIVDPPYGIGEDGKKNHSRGCLAKATKYKPKNWDKKPVKKIVLDEIIRVSKNQIFFGANHYISKIPYDSSCWIVWDKLNGKTDHADCELSWTSFKSAVRIIRYTWNGMIQGNMKNKEKRIHPTQKPVAIYKWILKNYAKPGQTIFDSYVGSGSIRIACHDMGFDFTGCELDPDYWQAQEDRSREHIKNKDIFSTEEYQNLIYEQGILE